MADRGELYTDKRVSCVADESDVLSADKRVLCDTSHTFLSVNNVIIIRVQLCANYYNAIYMLNNTITALFFVIIIYA